VTCLVIGLGWNRFQKLLFFVPIPFDIRWVLITYGLAGVEHRVFLGQFVVSAADYQPGLRLEFAATIGYANSGALDFASHSKNFYYGSGLGAPYVDDKIDNDVCSDVIFVNPNSRLVATWLMQGLTRKAGVNLGGQLPSGWRCEATGDLDGNGTVDAIDLAIVIGYWGTSGGKEYPQADIDRSGDIDAADLAAHQRFGSHVYFQLGFVASTTLPPGEGHSANVLKRTPFRCVSVQITPSSSASSGAAILSLTRLTWRPRVQRGPFALRWPCPACRLHSKA
jgi:hypothetical protein